MFICRMNRKFSKNERLKSRKLIQNIFRKGKSIKAFPVIAVYLPGQEHDGVKVGFSVAKKKIRKAVDRNLIKRRMLEAYRINRDVYEVSNIPGLALMLIYVKDEPESFEIIEKRMCRIFEKLKHLNSVNEEQSGKN